jgi:hypothetical protein
MCGRIAGRGQEKYAHMFWQRKVKEWPSFEELVLRINISEARLKETAEKVDHWCLMA